MRVFFNKWRAIWQVSFAAVALLTFCLTCGYVLAAQAQQSNAKSGIAQKTAAEAAIALSGEEVKQGEALEAAIKQAEQYLQATLVASVQGSFEAQTALEAIGRIRQAYTSLENLRLQKAGWEKDMRLLHCAECSVDLAAKALKRPPKPEIAKRE